MVQHKLIQVQELVLEVDLLENQEVQTVEEHKHQAVQVLAMQVEASAMVEQETDRDDNEDDEEDGEELG